MSEKTNNGNENIELPRKNTALKTNEKFLQNGKVVKFICTNELFIAPQIGDNVLLEDGIPKDGFYRMKDDYRYEIINGKLTNKYNVEKFEQNDGRIIEIDRSSGDGIGKGSRVWLNNEPAPEGIYKMGILDSINVQDGKIF
jgi:hypothetical protein